ncbi:MAG: nucleotidyltransferase domain-containing protein [Spirulina sp.]
MTTQLPTILTQTRQQLKTLYGETLDRLILFGSQARGDARDDSDIDLLIVLKYPFSYAEESDRISFAIADLCLKYNTLISCAFTTSEQLQQRNDAFFRNIRREGIII